MSLSKNQLKFITSLNQKKFREKHNVFIAEGVKVVQEFLQSSFALHSIFTTDDAYQNLPKTKVTLVTEVELKKISNLKTPNKVLAVFYKPDVAITTTNALILALDTINDPGNLGTIIRLCDWFGIQEIWCSNDTVDCYNPKVVQATMGSLTRVSVTYVNLVNQLKNSNLPIIIADMNGKNIYQNKFPKKAILVMGNEANGISDAIKKIATERISIPRFGKLQATESLNVATATAILLSEFKRGD